MHSTRFPFLTLFVILFCCSCANDGRGKKHANADGSEPDYDDSAQIAFDRTLVDLSDTKDLFTLLCQDWDNKDDAEAAAYFVSDSGLDMPYRGFSFFADKTMTKNPRGDIKFGNWQFDNTGKTILLSLNNGKIERYKIAALATDELKLAPIGDAGGLTVYSSQHDANKNVLEAPFYPANNKWRIKPLHAETDPEIKARLQACIHFFVLFYQHAISSKGTTVSFTGLPSCFRWYAGGIFLKKLDKLDKSWIDCFYNTAQAMQAYDDAGKLLEKKYIWPKGETNWLKQNVGVLAQMEKQVDSL